MREETSDLRIQHTDQLRPLGHLNAKELFDREAEGVLLVHRRDIIEPVEVRHRLGVGFVLDQLFRSAVQQPDMRIDALDNLAVELEDKPQHAMRGRMLRAEIDGEIAWRFGHQAMTFSAFCATRALNLSHATTARSCRPSPIRSTPSWARTSKASLRPSTLVHSTSTVTVKPGGVAARW